MRDNDGRKVGGGEIPLATKGQHLDCKLSGMPQTEAETETEAMLAHGHGVIWLSLQLPRAELNIECREWYVYPKLGKEKDKLRIVSRPFLLLG